MPVGWVAAGTALVGGASAYMQSRAAKDAAGMQQEAAAYAADVQRDMFDISRAQQAPFIQSGYGANDVLSRLMGISPNAPNVKVPGAKGEIDFGAAGMPDWQQYLLDNPDVAADAFFGSRPEEHYTRHGRGEGRTVPTIKELENPVGQGGGELDEDGYAKDNTGLPTGFLTALFTPEAFKAGIDPGYQWRQQQGSQSVMNTAAAGSGSLSGPALRALMEANQGMASQEFSNAFNRFQTQQGNIFQRLSSMTALGQNAAAGVGNNAMTAGGQIGANIVGGANAGAAGQIGSANAWAGGLSDMAAAGMWGWMNRGQVPQNAAVG